MTVAISSQYTYDPLGRGSGGPPAWMVWRLNHQGGNLQECAQINGVNQYIAPSWQPAGGIQLMNDATKGAKRPLEKTPEHQEPPQGSGKVDASGTCHGQWKIMGKETYLGDACLCNYMCLPCNGPVVWSGNVLTLPTMRGLLMANGSCFCNKPGPDTGCE